MTRFNNNDLSFDFDNNFKYSYKNDFETKDKEIDFLFEVNIFVFWVSTENGIITGIDGTRKEELISWGEGCEENENPYIVTAEEYLAHENDVKILNTKEYLSKIQKKINEI